MSDIVRLPVGEGPIRIKYAAAEWTPQRNKLILRSPIQWYCENDPGQKGDEGGDCIVMLDAAAITEPITNPLRVSLAWTGEKGSGKPPTATMHAPPDNAEPCEPTQAKGKGGGGRGGGREPRLTLGQMDALHERAVKQCIALMQEQGLTEATVADIAAMAATRFILYQDATDAPEFPADEHIAKLPGGGVTDEEIPFHHQAPRGGGLL